MLDAIDFEQAKRFGESLIRELESSGGDTTIRRALWTAFVVSYSRPFKGSRDRRNKPEPSRYRESLAERVPPDAQVLHDRILAERDKVVAHSDATVRDIKYTRTGDDFEIPISRNPYPPWPRQQVEQALDLLATLSSIPLPKKG